MVPPMFAETPSDFLDPKMSKAKKKKMKKVFNGEIF